MDNKSFKLLKLYAKRTSLSLKDLGAIYNTEAEEWSSPVSYLKELNYLEIHPTHVMLHGNDFTLNAPIRITYKGRSALETELKARRHLTFNEIRAWITLFIAISAFIKSFFL